MPTNGIDTTEFKVEQESSFWANIMRVVGTIIIAAPLMLQQVGEATNNDRYMIIGGAMVLVVNEIKDMLVRLGYIKSRADVKLNAER